MAITLTFIGVFYAIVIAILYITFRQQGDFDEYAVGGRAYGPLFIGMSYVQSWFPGAMFIAFFGLSAGLGVIGWYCLAYSLLGLSAMYFMSNRAWRWGRRYGLKTQPDLLGKRYNSNTVKVVASVIGVLSLLPWAILGMQAMGTIFYVATFGNWSVTVCLIVGILAIVIRQYWTVRMGMRGLIITDMFQGIIAYIVSSLIIIVILASTNSVGAWHKIADLPIEMLRVPGDQGTYGPLYMLSLVFMGTVGALAWPTSFQRIYTAKGVRAVKSGTVWAMGIAGVFYTCLTLLALAVSAYVAEDPQGGWFTSLENYGGTVLLAIGLVCVLGATMGHEDATVQVCGVQIANDLINRPSRPLSSKKLTYVAKLSMVGFFGVAAILAYFLFNIPRLQLLAQMSYYGIIQLSVPLFFGIFWRGGNKYAATASMSTGFVLACVLGWVWPDDMRFLGSLTAGMVALIANFFVFVSLAVLVKQSDEEKARVAKLFEETRVGRASAPGAVPAPVLPDAATDN